MVGWSVHTLITLPKTPSGPPAFLGFTTHSTLLNSGSRRENVGEVTPNLPPVVLLSMLNASPQVGSCSAVL